MRRRRFQALAAGAALLLLTGAAGLTLRHVAGSLPSFSSLLGRLDLRVSHVAVRGVPAPLSGAMESYFNEPGASFRARLAGLPERFPAVKTWKVRRDWPGRGARLEVVLRRAVARLQRAGRPAGFLDEDGAAFTAPEEIYPEARLSVEIGAAGADRLKGLPVLLELLSHDAGCQDVRPAGTCGTSDTAGAGLPAPLARVAFRGPYEGWEVGLQDGTEVLWGGLDWTREKLDRLREALSDARAAAPMHADLRYFADGRVLLRPLMAGNRVPAR